MIVKKIVLLSLFHLIVSEVICSGVNNGSQILVDTIYSEYLQENRLISVYLPSNYSKEKIYPVIFATDGQMLDMKYKELIDSSIFTGDLPELIIIGAFSNEKEIKGEYYTYRNIEYIKGWRDTESYKRRFDNHMAFFTEEVIKYAEDSYAITTNREQRYFYGCSNGAGFGVTLSVCKPELISNYICLSMAGGVYDNLKQGVENYPYISLFYGDKEPLPLTMQIDEYDKYLSDKGYAHKLTVYKGGHDRDIWRTIFVEHLIATMNN
ncbi:MAG: alpha/beta hydrolase-fold protein [Bacteroidales bacterium]|nr:alpha/beta hydrolase-fold protein [Bacteroidales bacterium]